MSRPVEVDVALVGAGGAGLSVVLALARQAREAARTGARTGAHAGARPGGRAVQLPTIALVDPVLRSGADRTWCFWDDGPGPLEEILHRVWSRLELRDRSGTSLQLPLGHRRYVMLRSQDFYAAAEQELEALGVVRVQAAAEVLDGPHRALVRAGGTQVLARWVLDSRPAAPRRPGRTTLLQHFRGWTVQLPEGALDPGLPTLMDFSVPQPPRGVAFTYCLPLDRRRALVEYTEFSRERLTPKAYDAALTAYLDRRWGVRPGAGALVEAVEDGVIPMTDAVFARRAGRRVFRLGTAGGATRPSTGYTFAAMQRQADAVAAALLAGREPLPPAPWTGRQRWMDAVLLRAVDRGRLSGADLFSDLFAANPVGRVLDFLDGRTGLAADLALMRSAPLGPMSLAATGDAVARLGQLGKLGHRSAGSVPIGG